MKSKPHFSYLPCAKAVAEALKQVISTRKVRPVVWRGDKRARGHFPSLKGDTTNFQSLLEESVLRTLEVATSVEHMRTHPFVLRLNCPSTGTTFHYTPDVQVWLGNTMALVETKGDYIKTNAKARATVKRASIALRSLQIPFAILVADDVKEMGLDQELIELMRIRPAGARKWLKKDPNQWDPRGLEEPSVEHLDRWIAAQLECDDLLRRVMRRDPGEYVESLKA